MILELAIFEDYRSQCGLVFCSACRHRFFVLSFFCPQPLKPYNECGVVLSRSYYKNDWSDTNMENLVLIVCVQHDDVFSLYYKCQSTNQMTTKIISLFVLVIKTSSRCKKIDPLDVLFPRLSTFLPINKIDKHLDIQKFRYVRNGCIVLWFKPNLLLDIYSNSLDMKD